MGTRPAAYVERYIWNRCTRIVVIAGAVAAAVPAVVTLPLLPAAVLFTVGAAAVVGGLLQRRVALRVDAAGVTLGGSPFRYRSTTGVVPWADVVALVLWQQVLPDGGLMPCLGLECRRGVSLPSGPAGRRGGPAVAGLVPDLPAGVLMTSRAVNGWRLERRVLAIAVARFAPDIWVLDHDTGDMLTGNGA